MSSEEQMVIVSIEIVDLRKTMAYRFNSEVIRCGNAIEPGDSCPCCDGPYRNDVFFKFYELRITYANPDKIFEQPLCISCCDDYERPENRASMMADLEEELRSEERPGPLDGEPGSADEEKPF